MSMLANIVNRVRCYQDRKRRLQEFRIAVQKALADGSLTPSELTEIEALRQELNLTEDEIKVIKNEVSHMALKAVKSDRRFTEEEEDFLSKVTAYFQIPSETIARSQEELDRYRLLYEIEKGNLPRITVPGLAFRKGELAHWSEPGSLIEEKTIKHRYGGSSSGISIRIAKGVTYRIGGHRGNIVTESKMVPVSTGELVLTNQRLIFRGIQKSISVTWDKVLDTQLYSDGVRFSLANRSKPLLVKFNNSRNTEAIGLIVSYLINNL